MCSFEHQLDVLISSQVSTSCPDSWLVQTRTEVLSTRCEGVQTVGHEIEQEGNRVEPVEQEMNQTQILLNLAVKHYIFPDKTS